MKRPTIHQLAAASEDGYCSKAMRSRLEEFGRVREAIDYRFGDGASDAVGPAVRPILVEEAKWDERRCRYSR